MNPAQLWIVAGPNGAGKSTLSNRFLRGRIPVVDPDRIARDLPRGAGGVLAQADAGRIALRERAKHLIGGHSFALETTLSGNGELKLMRAAADAGYKVSLVYVGIPDPELSALRVSERVKMGGHDVPLADLDRRYPRSMANLPKAMMLAARSFILDNSGRQHRLLLIREDGRTRYVARSLPRWAAQAIPATMRLRR